MQNFKEIEQERKKVRTRALFKNILFLVLFAVIVYVVAFVSKEWGVEGIKSAFREIAASVKAGDGFPVKLQTTDLLDLVPLDNGLLVVNKTDYTSYNETGRSLNTVVHGMANAAYQTAGDKILFFDRGELRAGVFSRALQMYAHTDTYPIHDGDVASDGSFALATGSNLHMGQVSVYHKEGGNIFTWYSEDRPITCLSMRSSGGEMVVGAISVENGMYTSRISRFSFQSDKPLGEVELSDCILLDLDYSDGEHLWALTDSRIYMFDKNLKEIGSFPLEEQIVKQFYYDAASAKTVLLLEALSANSAQEVLLLDASMKEAARWDAPPDTRDVYYAENHVYTIEKTGFSVFLPDGTLIASQSASGMEKLCVWNHQICYAASGELYQIPVPTPETDAQKEGS